MYSIFLDGKEYFVYSSSTGRGFTKKVASRCFISISSFVIIPKYFTVGLLQQKGKPRYLAYGVPGRVDRPPDDDGFAFFATQNNQVGFWIICQDANTGFAAEQPYFWV